MEAAPLAPDGWTTASYWRIIWKMWSGTDTDGFVLLGRHRQAPIIHRGQFICWELGTRRRHRRVNNYSLCRLFWVGLKNMIVSGWRLYCNFFRHSFSSSKLKFFHLNACINIFMRQQARKDEKQWSGSWSDVNIKGVAIFQCLKYINHLRRRPGPLDLHPRVRSVLCCFSVAGNKTGPQMNHQSSYRARQTLTGARSDTRYIK